MSKMIGDDDPLWYKDAIFYEVRVRSFFDGKGDGIGDFRGLAQKLDYIKDLGITTIWILPFYSSPMFDDGYDIADYTNVHPDYGTLQDFKFFLSAAHQRGLRVIGELVINHTSSQHPWFQRSRRAKPGSKWRDYYVWSDTTDRYRDARIIFKDFEISNWTWDPIAGAYYWHRFYSDQPDLNFDSPDVKKAIFKIVDFWFGMGMDGFRLDAIPYLFERDGTTCENLPETHVYLQELKAYVAQKFKGRMLLAEANQWPEDAVAYFGEGKECDMAFHFPIMPRMFMALHMEDRFPLIDILHQTPPIPESCQWALFLRNHDELTLEMVTDEERDYMYRMYAHEPRARINLGIRRRLAPLLENDRRKIELMNSLLFSLPGTPVVYYGDEIGMGDNIYLGDRDGVRTPMQWNSDKNAGFSKANPQKLYLPIIVDPEYHYNTVNVENQQNNPNSLLSWMKRMISLRKRFKAFGRGAIKFLEPKNRKVLAFIRQYENELILVVANFSRFVQYVELDLSAYKGKKPVELFGGAEFPIIKEDPYLLSLGRHSFYWFSIIEDLTGPITASRLSIPVLKAANHWSEIIQEKQQLEKALPDYLRACSWFESRNKEVKVVSIIDTLPIIFEKSQFHLLIIQVEYLSKAVDFFHLPLACAFGEEAKKICSESPKCSIVKVLVKNNKNPSLEEAVVYEAFNHPDYYKAFLEMIFKRKSLKNGNGAIVSLPLDGIRRGSSIDEPSLAPISIISSLKNALAAFGEKMVLKLFRNLEEGVNPNLEIGRFLGVHGGRGHFTKVRAAVEYQKDNGSVMTLGILQGYVPNQGTAWQFTLEELQKYFEEVVGIQESPQELEHKNKSFLEAINDAPPPQITVVMGDYLEYARLIGIRTAEFHETLASETLDKNFLTEPFTFFYQRSLYQSMRTALFRALESLQSRLKDISPESLNLSKEILNSQDRILKNYHAALNLKIQSQRIRCHGDYHLGQLLFTGKDFVIIDFEGDLSRPISERKIRRTALRDVVSMIASFHYAAAAALNRRIATDEKARNLITWGRVWQQWASSAFLKSYLQAVASKSFIPQDKEGLNGLLKVCFYDQAVRMLANDLVNNQELVDVPLHLLTKLLEYDK